MSIKAFDVNQWIQTFIGTLLIASVFGLISLYGKVETLLIEKKQESQLILEMKAQINLMQGKIAEQGNIISLLNQRVDYLQKMVSALFNRTPDMKGMIKDDQNTQNEIRPPVMTNWGANDISRKVGASCTGEECDLKPVDPPPPPPTTPKPTAK